MTVSLDDPYQGYLYAYPHKSAYRPFAPPRRLADLWREEDRTALFLYVHVPFCGARCGFCNLFTVAGGDERRWSGYVDSVIRHAEVTRDALGAHRFVQAAVGGGTPTFLPAADLDRLLSSVGWVAGGGPLSVETSPDSMDAERVEVLGSHRTTRVSMGVQSFADEEVRALGRPQRRRQVEDALDLLRTQPWALNLDLMYGMTGQTAGSFVASIDAALSWAPEELYLYPLYVRPLTGLGRSGRAWADQRLELYRAGRDRLLEAGYEQRSMRSFVRAGAATASEWCCQDDGMVGLGAGARSYTSAVHWSTEYAVAQSEVRRIVEDFVQRSDEDHGMAQVGIDLDEEEQRRRWVIKSVLRAEGLDARAYTQRFDTDPCSDMPVLVELIERGCLEPDGDRLRPTRLGLERGDAVGPALVSGAVRRRSAELRPR